MSTPRPPTSLNHRTHWATKATTTRQLRWEARIRAQQAHLPKGVKHCTIEMHYYPADNRRRDTDNLVPTLKAVCDGLIDYGLTKDDTPNFMGKTMPIIHPKGEDKKPHWWIIIKIRKEHPPMPEPTPPLVTTTGVDISLDPDEDGTHILTITSDHMCCDTVLTTTDLDTLLEALLNYQKGTNA